MALTGWRHQCCRGPRSHPRKHHCHRDLYGSPTWITFSLRPIRSWQYAYQVKLSNSFWKTRSRKGKSSLPYSLRSILKILKVALLNLSRWAWWMLKRSQWTYQAWTGGFTSPKFHSYAGSCPSGFMYHSLVSKSSCFLANAGSTTAKGIQWNAVSHAAKKGYSHLFEQG